jgi:hypothetical protein
LSGLTLAKQHESLTALARALGQQMADDDCPDGWSQWVRLTLLHTCFLLGGTSEVCYRAHPEAWYASQVGSHVIDAAQTGVQKGV